MRIVTSLPDPFVVPDLPDQGTAGSVPWGGHRFPNGKTMSTPRLVVGEKTAVFVIAGQSNCSNSVDTAYSPGNAAKVDNFNIYDGGMYRAVDPLLGCTIKTSTLNGNIFGRVADKLINAGWRDRIILATVGYGGSAISSWRLGGQLNPRLIIAPQRLAAVGLSVTAFIWMQGETDNNPLSTPQANYAAALGEVIGTPRALGFNAPWLIGKCTYINGATSAQVRAAQAGVANGTDIFGGADTDTLTGVANRYDDAHFSALGADAAADLWKAAIISALGA